MIALDSGDKIRGDASAASKVDYTISGLDANAIKPLASGQLAATIGDLYTADSTDAVTSIILVNTDTSARTVNLYRTPSGGTARSLIPKDTSLGVGYCLITDGVRISVYDASGNLQQTVTVVAHALGGSSHDADTLANLNAKVSDATLVDTASIVLKALFDANTILAATSDDTPAAISVAEQRLIGRITSGNITALTAAQVATLVQGSIDHGSLAGLADDDHTQYILKTLFDAQTILAAVSDDTPAALAVAASRILGRKATGNIAALTIAEVLTLLLTTKGDLAVYSTTPIRLGVGANGEVLTADSGEAAGVKWAAADYAIQRFRLNARYHSVPYQYVVGASITINQLYAIPFYAPVAKIITQMAVYITTLQAGKGVRMGIYTDNGSIAPGALLLDAGTVSTASTGAKEITGLSTGLVANTLYWLALVSDCTGAMQMTSGDGMYALTSILGRSTTELNTAQRAASWYYVAHTYGALPDPFGTPTIGAPASKCPLCWVYWD